MVEKTVSDFETIPQKQDYWCWAAASQMMQRKYLHNGIEQCQIVSHHFDQDCCKNPEKFDEEGPLILKGLKYNSTGENKYASWEKVKDEIDNNRAFIISSYSHYYIVIGYNDDSEKQLIIWDPLPTNAGEKIKKSMEWYQDLKGSQTYYNFSPTKI